MKTIKLKELRLTNFKGMRDLTVTFGEGTTRISGANATGKSTVFDAFTWCLFGKDSQNRQTFEIKTLGKDGNAIEKLMHEVKMTLTIDGKDKTFARQYVEDWKKKRGAEEATLEGHVLHYFVDELEMSKANFEAEVRAIIDEDTFKMVTSPTYFANLPAEDQRAALTQMVGTIHDEEILALYPELKSIIDEASGRDMNLLKDTIIAKKREIKKHLDAIPAQIQAIDSVTPEKPDTEALLARKAEIKHTIEEIDKAISSADAWAEAAMKRQRERATQINTLKGKQQDALFAEKRKTAEEYSAAQADYSKVVRDLAALKEDDEARHEAAMAAGRRDTGRIADLNREIVELTKKGDALLTKWDDLMAKQLEPEKGAYTCPLFRNMDCQSAEVRSIIAKKQDELKDKFYADVQMELDSIERQCADIKARKEAAQRDMEAIEQKMADDRKAEQSRAAQAAAQIGVKQGIVDNTPRPVQRMVVPEEIAEWMELQRQIDAIESDTQTTIHTDSSEAYKQQKRECLQQLEQVTGELAKEETIAVNAKRIEELKAEEKELAKQLAQAERKEYDIEQYTRAKMSTLESLVNGMFKLVHWSMYQKQINGGERLTCIPSVNGVPYAGQNAAMKVNMGLDIVNTIAKHKGVSAPIFVDNAEGVNEVMPTTGQQILLTVSEDKQLKIESMGG